MLEKQIKAPPRARNFFTMHIKPSQRFFLFFFFVEVQIYCPKIGVLTWKLVYYVMLLNYVIYCSIVCVIYIVHFVLL